MASHLSKRRWSSTNISCGSILISVIFILNCKAISIPQKQVHAVIIDGGSSGTRVHVFSFNESVASNSLTLSREYYGAINPGLSSYVDNPAKGARSLEVLLNQSKAYIPQTEWGSSPLSLKATAGLRLLPGDKAVRILDQCRDLLTNSGFLIGPDSVSIMPGFQEGIFSWVTVNFLLDRLNAQNHENTMAALDSGGGSAEITFVPDNKSVQDNGKDMLTINVFGKNISLYTHSDLGVGLMDARKAILTHNQNETIIHKNDSGASVVELHSKCINPNISINWTYNQVDYIVRGAASENFTGTDENRTAVRYSECRQMVKDYVCGIVNKPPGLENSEIMAFSNYIHVPHKIGLLNLNTGGIMTVDSFLTAAMQSCNHVNPNQPFMCLDLTIIHVILQDGYGLEPTHKIHLYDQIHNYRLSWALGAAIHLLHNGTYLHW